MYKVHPVSKILLISGPRRPLIHFSYKDKRKFRLNIELSGVKVGQNFLMVGRKESKLLGGGYELKNCGPEFKSNNYFFNL